MNQHVLLSLQIFVLVIVFIFLLNAYIFVTTYPFINDTVHTVHRADAALILGASVQGDGTLSQMYQERVDTAITLYEEGKVASILVSGDNGTVHYNEVDSARSYLLGKGVPEEDIFLDHAGFDTYSSMYRAREIFEVSSVLVVTQSFHLPRALFIARHLGLDAYGMRTGSGTFSNYVREVFANEKALLDLLFHRKPRYLGEKIPIPEN